MIFKCVPIVVIISILSINMMMTNKKYDFRSLHLDCARHFFSVETVKKVIEGISYGKLNVLHWHLSDDHAWRIESKKFPLLHESSGQYYTQEQIREIIDFAKERGIDVIPEIDMPGHNLALLSVYPEYSCKGESVTPARARGVYKTILCAGKEETYAFSCPLFSALFMFLMTSVESATPMPANIKFTMLKT